MKSCDPCRTPAAAYDHPVSIKDLLDYSGSSANLVDLLTADFCVLLCLVLRDAQGFLGLRCDLLAGLDGTGELLAYGLVDLRVAQSARMMEVAMGQSQMHLVGHLGDLLCRGLESDG